MLRICTRVLLLVGLLGSTSLTLAAQVGPAAALAPTGRLRAAINLGNPVLAQKNLTSGELGGVSVALARELGRRLGVPVDLIPYDAAGKVSPDSTRHVWDLAFLARDPERAKTIVFTAPYVFIEGTYLVRVASPFRRVQDLDQAGVKIAVGRGAAYDLSLARTLKYAQLIRAPSSQAAIDQFLANIDLQAAAGVRQALVASTRGKPGFRVLDPGFSRIDQALAIPKDHAAAAPYLEAFLREMKTSGFVRHALDESGQQDAVVSR